MFDSIPTWAGTAVASTAGWLVLSYLWAAVRRTRPPGELAAAVLAKLDEPLYWYARGEGVAYDIDGAVIRIDLPSGKIEAEGATLVELTRKERRAIIRRARVVRKDCMTHVVQMMK